MKRSLLVIGIIISLGGVAQPTVKLYGYSQQYFPGMVPQRDIPDENGGGRSIKVPAVTTNYYVYTRTSVLIRPDEIWVGGKWYVATGELVKTTPVVSESPKKKTLVPSTTLKVQQIGRGDTVSNTVTRTNTLKKMMAANELIVAYTWKGKKYYAALKKLVKLEPFHAQ